MTIENTFNNKWQKYFPVLTGFFLLTIILIKFFYTQHLLMNVSPFMGSDPFGYLLKSREILTGDWSQMKTHAMGWSIIMAPFFYFWNMSENFQYMPLQMTLSIIFSLLSVPLFYLLAKKYLSEIMALAATSVYALSPLMIENSLLGLTEPAFMSISFLAFMLLLKKNRLGIILAFFLSGVAFWLRTNGLFFFIAYFLIAWLIFKIPKKDIVLGIIFFLILFIPYVVQRSIQFGSVFNYGSVSRYFHNDYRTVWAENYPTITLSQFWQENGLAGSVAFLLKGLKKLITHFRVILYPLTMMLLPLGLWQVYKKRKPEIVALILFCLITFAPLFLFYPAQGNMRHLYFLLPFLIILAFYGLNEFLNKKIIQSLLLIGIIFTCVVYIQFFFFYQKPLNAANAPEQAQEGQYLVHIIKGKIAEDASSMQVFTPHIKYIKNTNNATYSNGEISFSYIWATDFTTYLNEAKKYNFTHIFVRKKNAYSFLDEVYENSTKYDKLLTKVYDSEEFGLNTKAKVFKIK